MRTHNNLKDLLAHFSVNHHKWLLEEDDNRTFDMMREEYLSDNCISDNAYRDLLAKDIIKIHVNHQVKRRRMSLLSRIKWWLNIDGWQADYDLNAKDIIKKSYEFADIAIKARDDYNNPLH